MLLDKIKVTKDVRCLSKGLEIEFSTPLTLLVGDIGTGKSTMLDMIRGAYGVKGRSYFKEDTGLGKNVKVTGNATKKDVMYYDFHSDDMKYAGVFGEDMGAQLVAMNASSGQGALLQLKSSGILDARGSLILFDSIGRDCSIKAKNTLATFLVPFCSNRKNQVIASTHEREIMLLEGIPDFARLYSMEHLQFMNYDDFLETQAGS